MAWSRYKPNITKAQIADARAVPLLEYLQQRGYALRKEGRYYRLQDHDSLVIDPAKNCWHWNSRGIKSASTPDFLANYEGMNFEDAVLTLLHETSLSKIPIRQPTPKEKNSPLSPTTPPTPNENNARAFTYLTKTRGIATRLVQELIREGVVYESANMHNAVFLRRVEGKTVDWFERGTLSFGKPFKRCPDGNDKRYEFLLTGSRSDCLYVCEAAIDCLSVESIRCLLRLPAREVPVLSLGGNSLIALEQYIKDTPSVSKVCICTDNDKGGEIAWAAAFETYGDKLQLYRSCPPSPYKDWNEVLVAIRNKQYVLNSMDCLETFEKKERNL